MGEHARYQGQTIKIGTCENMYYLRAEQRAEVEDYDFPPDVLGVIRFRFPFPDEDEIEPGHFEDYGRGVSIPGWSLPETLSGDEHGSVQFTSSAGYVLSIPCPEGRRAEGDVMSTEVDGLTVHRNGFRGGPVVRQQAFRGGSLVTLVSCGACGALHRLDTIEDARPVIEAFRSEADRNEYRAGEYEPANSERQQTFLRMIAERIEAGYAVTAEVSR